MTSKILSAMAVIGMAPVMFGAHHPETVQLVVLDNAALERQVEQALGNLNDAQLWLLAQAQNPNSNPQPPAPPNPSQVRLTLPGGYLGIGIREITSERANTLKLREEYGVEVTRIDNDSPAGRSGLKEGDVVLQYNGNRVEGLEQFSRMVRETPVGRDVKLTIWRGGSEQQITAKVSQRPFPSPDFRMPDISRIIQESRANVRGPLLGVESEPLEGQLAEYFGVKDGVLIHSVLKDSPADKAGLKAGDVILRVDDMKVVRPQEVTARMRAAGKTATLGLMRDHKEMTVTVTPEQQSQRGRRVERMRLLNGDHEQ